MVDKLIISQYFEVRLCITNAILWGIQGAKGTAGWTLTTRILLQLVTRQKANFIFLDSVNNDTYFYIYCLYYLL